MRQLRIFSYLPNPRIWKATIAARLTSVDIEVRGGSPKEFPYLEKIEGATQADP
jgi:elongation factor 1-gamma